MATGLTYNLGLFLGPGLPRTLGIGSPSGPNATAELLFTPLFLMISLGGGIDEGPGVPLATGVLVVDAGGASPGALAAAAGVAGGRGFETVDGESLAESLEGDSSLITVLENFFNFSGDIFSLIILEVRSSPFDVDFLLLLGGAIVARCDGDGF